MIILGLKGLFKGNEKNSHGEQIYRSAKNTAKTHLLRPALFNLLGTDKTIRFYYRQKNELDDATIALSLQHSSKKLIINNNLFQVYHCIFQVLVF